MIKAIENFFYRPSRWPFFFNLLSLPWQIFVHLRKKFLIRYKQDFVELPLIVVGNLTHGGVGKTPFVIALVKACLQQGLKPGVVSRGYKARIKKFPHLIGENDSAQMVGDEPCLIARSTGCPVVIAPKRLDAARYLVENQLCDLIISDDGLQHYAMGRNLEIIVIDGLRGFGNGFCPPVGPLREKPKRLSRADFIIINGQPQHPSLEDMHHYPWFKMTVDPLQLENMVSGKTLLPQELPQPIAAITGIGHPERFYNTLDALKIPHNPYSFPDHYQFKLSDMNFSEKTVVMTAKDAVKCKPFAKECWYFLPVEAKLCDTFWETFWLAIKDLK